jgi:hypothetical protein
LIAPKNKTKVKLQIIKTTIGFIPIEVGITQAVITRIASEIRIIRHLKITTTVPTIGTTITPEILTTANSILDFRFWILDL